MKRKLPWGTRRRIGTVIYIAMILAVDIFLVTRWVTVRQEKVREVEKLETSREIANKFMCSKYNGRWMELDEVFWVEEYEASGEYSYQVSMANEEPGWLDFILRRYDGFAKELFKISDDYWAIELERTVGVDDSYKTIKFHSVYQGQNSLVYSIWGYVYVYYSEEKRENPEKKYFDIHYVNGEYVLEKFVYDDEAKNKDLLEQITNMTFEEIVEMGCKDYETIEEMLYKIKNQELDYLNIVAKKSMWKKILWTGGISMLLISIGIISEAVDRRYAE